MIPMGWVVKQCESLTNIPEGYVRNPAWQFGGDNRAGWFVGLHRPEFDRCCFISISFGREKDALIAKDSLESAGIFTREDALAAGPEKVRRLMLENLQW